MPMDNTYRLRTDTRCVTGEPFFVDGPHDKWGVVLSSTFDGHSYLNTIRGTGNNKYGHKSKPESWKEVKTYKGGWVYNQLVKLANESLESCPDGTLIRVTNRAPRHNGSYSVYRVNKITDQFIELIRHNLTSIKVRVMK